MLASASICSVTAHRAQLGRHRAADAAGQHRGCQHGAQFAHERHVDDRSQSRLQVHQAKLRVALHGQHHADEGAGQADHRKAQNANLIKVRQQRATARPPRSEPDQGLNEELGHLTDRHDPLDDQAADAGDRIDDRAQRSGRRRGIRRWRLHLHASSHRNPGLGRSDRALSIFVATKVSLEERLGMRRTWELGKLGACLVSHAASGISDAHAAVVCQPGALYVHKTVDNAACASVESRDRSSLCRTASSAPPNRELTERRRAAPPPDWAAATRRPERESWVGRRSGLRTPDH